MKEVEGRIDSNTRWSSRTQSKSDKMKSCLPKNESNSKTKVNCGFRKSLVLKGLDGRESCFEEARARANYFKIAPDNNFNFLEVAKTDACENEKSDMDMDINSTVEEIEMDENSATDVQSKPQSMRKKVIFDVDTSTIENRSIINRHNTSTASSTVNENDAVGVYGDKEETLNTKFAAHEVSMMFASPCANQNGMLDQSLASNRKCHKHVKSNDLLFSAHGSDMQNCIEMGRKNGDNASRATIPIFQDDDSVDDSDSQCNLIHSEDRGNGDTASLADVLEAIADNDTLGNCINCESPINNIKQKGTRKSPEGGMGFSIFCDEDNGSDPAPAFGDISFIPQDDNTYPDLVSKVRGMHLTEN